MLNGDEPQIYEFGEFRLDAGKRMLFRGEADVMTVTSKVFDTLLYLVMHRGMVIEKSELMSALWNDTIVEENNLNKNISKLRRILGEKHGENLFIVTIPGKGYQFVADVREIGRNEWASVSGGETEYKPTISEAPPNNEMPGRFWLFGLALMCLIGLSSLGLFVWRENRNIPSVAQIRTLAVLPFKPLVADQRDETLEFGMADALIAKLSGIDELAVRPLSSVRKYYSSEQDALMAGRELNVEAILDGTIQMSGDRVRVSVRLLRIGDGKQLWTGQFDEGVTDIFSIQDSISERVAAALHTRLTQRSSGETANIEAYQLYMRGRFHTLKLNADDIQKGITYFRQATVIDPGYALAYAGLADALRTAALFGTPEMFADAKVAALKAIEIDHQLADGHAILGFIIFWHDWDWAAAEAEMKQALSLDPNNADARFAYAHLLSNLGRHNEALAQAKLASELDPLNFRIAGFYGMFLVNAGKTDEAMGIHEKARELNPNFPGFHLGEAAFFLDKGMFAEAVESARRAKELPGGNPLATAFLAYALARSGNQAEARALLKEIVETQANRSFGCCNIALVHSGLGETDKALDWLEQAFRRRDPCMTFLKVDRKWDDLRSGPRFIELMRRMNFD